MFNFFNKKDLTKENYMNDIIENTSTNISNPKREKQEEWIWIEGYKGTDKDMKCRDFQYELNKTFSYDGKTNLCGSGFHFCLQLKDVFNYYKLNANNKFFKVKGLVKREDYHSASNSVPEMIVLQPRWLQHDYDSKVVAKEIVFIEELQFEDLKDIIKNKMPMVETEEEYYFCKDNYKEFCKNKLVSKLINLGFSDLFSQLKYEDFSNEYDIDDKKMYKYLTVARAYKKENLSKDIMIYLLEKI
ncbi:DUF7666 domain-containing protein [Clostridium botulinum]|uniref:DUF7666 domain-containing protein n=1 Tax=Clostridium botulinum TaxID=1491 RepID=UPI0007737F32|nr:hypothetical protein [Clostridium botulinum]APH20884.1 hypothetical protein NPD1_4166 [Clostridium botulinum]APQ71378.1 hypothetical protein RSJ8_4123 [Clostridium botulinum]MBN3379267.1 hypothetical protein [Clostridium botulinum]